MQLLGSLPPNKRIIRLVGSGGMGVVYEAWDTRLERRVALKVLHPHLMVEQAMRDRLLKEARLAARVEHEGVVRIYNVHENDGGVCMEMEFVEGVPLNRLLAARPFTIAHGTDLLDQVLDALAACHGQNVVHCDLKPSNLMITPTGKVMLADFGISRAIYGDDDAPAEVVVSSGPLWGTPQYCPPEIWHGGTPTLTWDLYALGVLIFEALSGSLPFESRTHAMLMREKLDGKEVSIRERRPNLSPELAEIIDSLQSRHADSRPANAEEVIARLRQTPEYHDRDANSRPLRHRVVSASQTGDLSEMLTATQTLSPPVPASAPARWALGWKSGVFGIGLFLCLIALAIAPLLRPADSPDPSQSTLGKAEGLPGKVQELVVYENTAYFSYDDGRRGRELWVAERSGQARMVADINPGIGSSNPKRFVPRKSDGVMFAGYAPESGQEPYIIGDGPSFKTHLLADIVPGPMSSNPRPVLSWEHLFFFCASQLDLSPEIWVSNGLSEKTGKLADLFPEIGGGYQNPHPMMCSDATGTYFLHRDAAQVKQLWRYTPEDGQLRALGPVPGEIGEMTMLGNKLLFPMQAPDVGFELWMYDPDVDEIQLVRDIWEGPKSGRPEHLFTWNDAVYFRATTEGDGTELWRTDGSPEGTQLIYNLNPGDLDSGAYGFVATADHLFYRAYHNTFGDELWITNGQVGDKPQVFDVFPGSQSSHPYSIAALDSFLFFTANDGVHGEELWAVRLDAIENGPFLVRDIRKGPESSEPHDLTLLDEKSAIFVHNTPTGDVLMKLAIVNGEITLTPYSGLHLKR